MTLITIGVDAHKRVHVAQAVDPTGRELAAWRGPNSPHGWESLRDWALLLGPDRHWGIEGAWGFGRGLAQFLVASDEIVFEINPRWTAVQRRKARRPGKTDKLDARAVASFVLEEAPTLPRVYLEDATALLDLLTTEREAAVFETTRLRNQIHALLLKIDAEYESRLPALRSKLGLEKLLTYQSPSTDPLQEERAASVRRLAQRLALAQCQVDELKDRISLMAEEVAGPLTKLCGVSLLTAGTLAAILGPGNRFSSDAQLAAYAGAAPLEASSAGLTRHRLNRGGNRRLNAILYRIVLTQAHYHAEAKDYIRRRVSQGKTKREAHRALRRYVVRAIWRLWQECCQERNCLKT